MSKIVRQILLFAAASALVLMLDVPTLRAQLPRTRLDSVFPAGGRAGSNVSVAIKGELADAATDLVFSHPGITATQQLDAPTEYTVAHRKPGQFDVSIDPEVPDGRYELQALGPAGLSGPRSFVVSRLRELTFDAKNNSRSNALQIEIGDTVNAKSRNDQRDYYRFAADRSSTVLIQVWAERIESKMDAVISVRDAESGRRVARSKQGMTRDPVITFQPPESGDYVIEVSDATYRGGDDYGYRLEVSRRAQVDAIHPVAARPGIESEFTLYGHNLPGGTPVSGGDRLGNLQSMRVRFRPDFEHGSFAQGFAIAPAAAARIDGASVKLPVPLSSSCVFLAEAGDEVLAEQSNDDIASAQSLSLPCEVAGQFFPRRDVDWYTFEANKGDRLWVELATQQVGTLADPILHVRKRATVAGDAKWTDVATSDDVEGAANSRDKRRFHSGTGDIAYQLVVAEDTTYAISVADQFNASADDPRLTYRLRVSKQPPDFQLVAFADPERFPDVKKVVPNGVSVMPGGSASIRVRLLPKYGFREDVRVTVSGLPSGVVAHPLILNRHQREGLLVLTASEDVTEDIRDVSIRGDSLSSDHKRTARVGVITRGVGNVDADETKSRLTDSLSVAVVKNSKAPGVRFESVPSLETSLGAELKLPASLTRGEGIGDAELSVEVPVALGGVKFASAKAKTNRAQVSAKFQDKKIPTGRYTIPIAAKLKEKRARNVIQFEEAKADLDKVVSVLETRESLLAHKQAVFDRLAQGVGRLGEQHEKLSSNSSAPRSILTAMLKKEQDAAAELAKRISAAAIDVGNASLEAAVSESEAKLLEIRAERKPLQQKLATQLRPLSELGQVLSKLRAEVEQQRKELDALKAKRDEAATKRQEAQKRLDEVRKAQMEKEVEYWVYAPPVEVRVHPSPLKFASSGEPYTMTVGETVEIPIAVHRNYGFRDQITINASFSDKSGLHASPLVLGAGQQLGRLVVRSSAQTKLGEWKASLQSTIRFNGLLIEDNFERVVRVVAKEEKKTK